MKSVKTEGKLRAQRLKNSSLAGLEGDGEQHRISIDIHHVVGYSELVISGLNQQLLQRLLPQINKDIITQLSEENALKAGLLRFFREGTFQTVVKVIAGLIVGILLYKFGLK